MLLDVLPLSECLSDREQFASSSTRVEALTREWADNMIIHQVKQILMHKFYAYFIFDSLQNRFFRYVYLFQLPSSSEILTKETALSLLILSLKQGCYWYCSLLPCYDTHASLFDQNS